MTKEQLMETIEKSYREFSEAQKRLPDSEKDQVLIIATCHHKALDEDGDRQLQVIIASQASPTFIEQSISSLTNKMLDECPGLKELMMIKVISGMISNQ